ncbi:MAG: phage antirepressor N-terminal domain-containing protein [Chloroflexota bacterium]
MSNEGKALIPIEEKLVDFYGDELAAVLVQDDIGEVQVYVPVRPICSYLGLAWPPQYSRIQRDPVLSEAASSVTVTVTEVGQRGVMVCLPLKYLPGWLFGISVNRVRPELQGKIIRYQRECYDVLWKAFQTGRLTTDTDIMQGDSPAVQAYHLAMAVVELARNQVLMETRLSSRLDEYGRRLEQIEATLGDPGRNVSPEQASQLSQAIKAVAMKLSEKSGRNEYGGVYGELYRRFGITSYKLLSAQRFQPAMRWLTEWYQSVTGGEEAPF